MREVTPEAVVGRLKRMLALIPPPETDADAEEIEGGWRSLRRGNPLCSGDRAAAEAHRLRVAEEDAKERASRNEAKRARGADGDGDGDAGGGGGAFGAQQQQPSALEAAFALLDEHLSTLDPTTIQLIAALVGMATILCLIGTIRCAVAACSSSKSKLRPDGGGKVEASEKDD